MKEIHAERVTLTLGELRRATAHLPDDEPITIGNHDGWYDNIDGATIPTGEPDSDDAPSVILELGTPVDTRQW